MIAGSEARARRESIGVTLDVVATLASVSVSGLSSWERDRSSALSAKSAKRVIDTLAAILGVKKKFRGVPIDMSDIRFLRKQIRELGRGKQPAPIEQTFGSQFISQYQSHVRLSDEELAEILQLRPAVLHAEILSLPCQRWVAAWLTAIASVLSDRTVEAYVSEFPSRREAIESLVATARETLIKEVGESQLDHYRCGLTITGELLGSPRDIEEN